jgi:hypothetical protein
MKLSAGVNPASVQDIQQEIKAMAKQIVHGEESARPPSPKTA